MNKGKELQTLGKLSRALESAALDGGFGDKVIDTDKILSEFEEIERQYTTEHSGRQRLIRPIKRIVTEWKLIVAEEAELPYEKIECLFEEMNRMGYENDLIEFDIALLFVRVCIRSKKVQEAKNGLGALRIKVSRLPKTMAKNNYEQWIATLDERIDNLSKNTS